jgi:hypothetical protein
MSGHGGAVVGRQPDGLGLGDQIADGEDEPVLADDHSVSGPLGAQNRRGERVLRDLGAQQYHRVERSLEVEAHILRFRLQVLGKSPVIGSGHTL